jgi:hypothetical protein
VGVAQKLIGAVKGQLISQFLTEAALITCLSISIAWGLDLFMFAHV